MKSFSSQTSNNLPGIVGTLFALVLLGIGVLYLSGAFSLPSVATAGTETIVAVIQAEGGVLASPMVNRGDYIRTTKWSEGTATYTVDVPTNGDYRFEFLVHAPSGSADSLFFSVDGQNEDDLHFYVRSERSGFVWKTKDTAIYRTTLTKGTHTFVIRGREKDTDIDAFRMILEGASVPIPPTANAGPDQEITAPIGASSASAGLNGGSSSDDGSIVSYEWLENGAVIATVSNPTVSLPLGTHTITLRVTDNDGLTGEDTVVVTVVEGVPVGPTANAGADQTVTAPNGNGSAGVTLNGGSSSDDGSIVSYEWLENGAVIATVSNPTVSLPLGTHTITLRVTDNDGLTGEDTVVVTVVEGVPVGERPWEDILNNVVGFGKNTTGGKAGELCRVTNLNNSGSGSLRACAEADVPLWIVFDVSGTINLSTQVVVKNNKTIDGRGQDVTLTGSGLNISSRDNVIVHNITIRTVSGDAITVYRSTNVWVDHVTMENASDGLLDITEQSRYVTASWNILRNQNKTMLIGASNDRTQDSVISVTLHHNYYYQTERRNPLVRYGSVHMFNNLLSHWGTSSSGGDGVNSTYGAQVLLERNIFDAGLNKMAVRTTVPGFIEVPGYIKAVENLALNGANVFSSQPENVFTASGYYNYQLETADQALVDKVVAGAGRQNVAAPAGI